MQTNPWYVESIEDFTFICCPECSYKSKTESKFQLHALENHPQCLVFFYEASDNNSTSTTKIYYNEDITVPNQVKLEEESFELNPETGAQTDNQNLPNEADIKDIQSVLEVAIKEENDSDYEPFHDIIKEDQDDENSDNEDNNDDPDYNLVMRVSAKDSKPKRKPRKKVVKPRVVKKEEDFDGDSRKFPCEFCGKDFNKASEKRTHWKKEHVNEKGELLCKDCPQTFKEQNLLRRHIYFKHTSLRCEECDKTFTKNVYKKHMETVHADKSNRQYQCDQCSYTSYAMKYIYDHKSMAHYNEKESMCKTCGQKFPSKVLLKTHKCGTNEEKSANKKIEYVTCKLCDQQFRSKTFVMHYRRVHGGYPPGYENRRKYMCDQCSAEFLTDISLKRHIILQHGTEPPKEFRCDKCAQDFTGFRYLLIHFRHVHKDIPPEYKDQPQFICDQCPDIFLNESHLKGHISRKHSKEPQPVAPPKKYVRKQCPHCEKTFGGYNPLQEHILVKHDCNTPHQCNQCPRKFGLSHTLRVHKQYVHTKVRCEVCNEEVCNSFVLKRHKAAVHGLVPTNALKCQLCPMFFHAKKSLQNHMEKKHG